MLWSWPSGNFPALRCGGYPHRHRPSAQPPDRQQRQLPGRQEAPSERRRPPGPPAGQRRDLCRPRSGDPAAASKAGETKTHEQPGIPLCRQGRELEVPADEYHRPVYAVRRNPRGLHLPDGGRGVPGAVDGGAEKHHLHHAGGQEVPGRPAPRQKVHQGGHGI